MLIIEDPLKALYISLGVLIFFKVLFKIANYLESCNAKGSAKKDSKPKEVKKEESKVEKSAESETKDKEPSKQLEMQNQDIVVIKDNYLYDRFVLNPTKDDDLYRENLPSDAFLSDNKAQEIKERKIKIDVTPVKDISRENEISNELNDFFQNKEDKEKLLKQFNSLSKETKMFILEDILSRME